ncbi:EAL domain-containing protein [Lelliottia sp. RWM.1]|uniref:EAL domain-containing protein n=1 Tax=Lelliottia sp. RWM.1 TaxID=2663242 RepID=UPI00193E7808|nr:EAL domain-containing protein [Lelliottia sp. RWM.1]MBM3069787.1 EAL domain-containing protein [Lelliottia sp. RWM.1]
MTALNLIWKTSPPNGDISRLRRISRDITGIKLEPIVALASSRTVGVEVLSVLSPHRKSEPFFQEQSPEQSLLLLEAQLATFKNSPPGHTLFINLPITVFTLTDAFQRLLRRGGPRLNIEIVEPTSLFALPMPLRERVVRHLQQLSLQGHRIWLDDVDETSIHPFLSCRLPLSGIKIDKMAFWRLRATPALAQLVNLCSQIAGQVLIEGIETKRDHAFALQAGAGLGQGYHWPSRQWP